MKHIQFLNNHAPYAKDEIASFEDAIADSYVRAKIAVEHTLGEVANAAKGTGKKNDKVGE